MSSYGGVDAMVVAVGGLWLRPVHMAVGSTYAQYVQPLEAALKRPNKAQGDGGPGAMNTPLLLGNVKKPQQRPYSVDASDTDAAPVRGLV